MFSELKWRKYLLHVSYLAQLWNKTAWSSSCSGTRAFWQASEALCTETKMELDLEALKVDNFKEGIAHKLCQHIAATAYVTVKVGEDIAKVCNRENVAHF